MKSNKNNVDDYKYIVDKTENLFKAKGIFGLFPANSITF